MISHGAAGRRSLSASANRTANTSKLVVINFLFNFPFQLQFNRLFPIDDSAPDSRPKELAIFEPNDRGRDHSEVMRPSSFAMSE
jgi:hypothetical protein